MTLQQEELLNTGREMIAAEIRALTLIEQSLGFEFIATVEHILNSSGKLIITGMGKSGHIARKIAATITSTGTPAIYLHPAEAAHGDLGIIANNDTILALSYSGETDEILRVAHFAKAHGNKLIAITGTASSQLATMADIHLNIQHQEEDCVINVVPTTSTTVQLALGDAIATALMYARGFKASDFAHLHPGGYMERKISMASKE